MSRLWDKGDAIDQAMHRLTVGRDYELDLALLPWDCVGSAAHACMLHKVGLLRKEDLDLILPALDEARQLAARGEFTISPDDEDCHTALENFLVTRIGEAGKRIHTGRSRNDQVLLATRLYLRFTVASRIVDLGSLAERFYAVSKAVGHLAMPGYTHMQPAMPSSLALWLHAYIEGILEMMQDGVRVLDYLDENPLGSGAGFGTSLPLDRRYVADLLGFSRVQRSFLDAQNSRGRKEDRVLAWCAQVGGIFEKFASDVVLFCTSEFGFFALPPRLSTGSSIMPQKRNPDIAELLRGRAARIRAAHHEVVGVSAKLPSSYHRDLQFTKEPLMRGLDEVQRVLESATLIIEGIEVREERLKSAMIPELFATYDAYEAVAQGVPFRTAYAHTAKKVTEGSLEIERLKNSFNSVQAEVVAGIDAAMEEVSSVREFAERSRKAFCGDRSCVSFSA